MIRTVVIPDQQNISIHVPNSFVGKKVEVLLYTIEEVNTPPAIVKTQKKPSDFAGSLPLKAANKLLKYIEQSRNEWERSF